MKPLLRIIYSSLALLFCAALLILSGGNPSQAADTTPTPTLLPYFATPTPQPACPPNCDHLKTIGSYFILKLKFPYQRETTLTAEQIKEQRAKIHAAQNEVAKIIVLPGWVEISYDAVPYMLFYGLDETIKSLSKHPLVEGIYLDSPLNEVFSMELDSIPEITGEMLDTTYGKPLPRQNLPDQKCLVLRAGANGCETTIETAQQAGSVTVDVVFKLPRAYTVSLDLEFQSLQEALMRQIRQKFFEQMRGQKVSIFYRSTFSSAIMLTTDSVGIETILKLPMVAYIVDSTGIQVCAGDCHPQGPYNGD